MDSIHSLTEPGRGEGGLEWRGAKGKCSNRGNSSSAASQASTDESEKGRVRPERDVEPFPTHCFNRGKPQCALGSMTRSLRLAGFSDKRVWGANGHLAGLVWK